MRLSIALVTLLFAITTECRADLEKLPAVTYPQITSQAQTAAGFVPEGWKLETSATGDLNGDGMSDLALVIRQNAPLNVVSNEGGLGVDPLDSNPRMLLVAFGNKAGGYRLQLANHTLIPRHDNPTIDDPYDGIEINKGALKVALHFWANAGSWSTSNTKFTFRFRNGCFLLVGYDHNETRRNSGETSDTSINLLTGKMKFTTGSINDDHTTTRWKPYTGKTDICIDAIGDGSEFNLVD